MGGLIDAAMLSGSLKPCRHKIIIIYEAKPSDSSQTQPFWAAMTHHYGGIAFPIHWLPNPIEQWF